MLSVLWNLTMLDFQIDRVFSYGSERFGGPMSLTDWLLYFAWIVNPYQFGASFSLLGWGGVKALIHSVSAALVSCGLGYLLSRQSDQESEMNPQVSQEGV